MCVCRVRCKPNVDSRVGLCALQRTIVASSLSVDATSYTASRATTAFDSTNVQRRHRRSSVEWKNDLQSE
jgi:hypothetical protein